jgi:hypothetical protein
MDPDTFTVDALLARPSAPSEAPYTKILQVGKMLEPVIASMIDDYVAQGVLQWGPAGRPSHWPSSQLK